jgi:hypothetical protein
MRISRSYALTSVLLLASSANLLGMPHPHRGPTSPKLARSHAAARSSSTHSAAAVSIAPARATQIQTALIKSGYMTGEPTGVWDSTSQAAMVKLQGDNGWQTKLVPDSRALIKLGLGPGSISAEQGATEASATTADSSPLLNQ